MVNAGSRCVARLNGMARPNGVARLNVGVAVATAAIVVLGFVGAAPPVRGAMFDAGAVRVAAVNTSMSARWAALEQFVDTHADVVAAAVRVVGGGSSGVSAAAATTPTTAG